MNFIELYYQDKKKYTSHCYSNNIYDNSEDDCLAKKHLLDECLILKPYIFPMQIEYMLRNMFNDNVIYKFKMEDNDTLILEFPENCIVSIIGYFFNECKHVINNIQLEAEFYDYFNISYNDFIIAVHGCDNECNINYGGLRLWDNIIYIYPNDIEDLMTYYKKFERPIKYINSFVDIYIRCY